MSRQREKREWEKESARERVNRKKREIITTTSDAGSPRGASCWRLRELLGSINAFLLQPFLGFSWKHKVATFCPLEPPQASRATGVWMATAVAESTWWAPGLSQPHGRRHTREGGEGLERRDETTLGTTVVLCSPGVKRGEDDSSPFLQNLLGRLWSLLEAI